MNRPEFEKILDILIPKEDKDRNLVDVDRSSTNYEQLKEDD
jgi:hypothetical protein